MINNYIKEHIMISLFMKLKQLAITFSYWSNKHAFDMMHKSLEVTGI